MGRLLSLDSQLNPKKFALPLFRCGDPYTRTMWSASIAGTPAKTLRRHISTQHGLSPDEYLKALGVAERSSFDRSRLFRATIDIGHGKVSPGTDIHSTGFGRCRSEVRGETHTETKHPFGVEIRSRE
jgi:hypothetical protein